LGLGRPARRRASLGLLVEGALRADNALHVRQACDVDIGQARPHVFGFYGEQPGRVVGFALRINDDDTLVPLRQRIALALECGHETSAAGCRFPRFRDMGLAIMRHLALLALFVIGLPLRAIDFAVGPFVVAGEVRQLAFGVPDVAGHPGEGMNAVHNNVHMFLGFIPVGHDHRLMLPQPKDRNRLAGGVQHVVLAGRLFGVPRERKGKDRLFQLAAGPRLAGSLLEAPLRLRRIGHSFPGFGHVVGPQVFGLRPRHPFAGIGTFIVQIVLERAFEAAPARGDFRDHRWSPRWPEKPSGRWFRRAVQCGGKRAQKCGHF